MVSLESRLSYIESIKDNHKLNVFYQWLNLQNIDIQNIRDLNQIDKTFFNLLLSIKDNNKANFSTDYNVFTIRQPGKDSPFVHDDYLIFILLVGIIKFNIDTVWIKTVLAQRATNAVTETFKNIVENNFYDNRNLKYVVLSFKALFNETSFDKKYFDDTYLSIINNANLFNEKNDFLILTSLRAFDLIIIFNDPPSIEEFSFLKKFEITFFNRTQFLAASIYFIFLALLTYLCTILISDYEWINQFVQKIVTILAIVLMGLPYSLKKVRYWLEKKVRQILGYNK